MRNVRRNRSVQDLNIQRECDNERKRILRIQMTNIELNTLRRSNLESVSAFRQRLTPTNINAQRSSNRLRNSQVHSRRLRRFREKMSRELEDFLQRSTRIQRRFNMEARGRKFGEISSLYFECEYCKALKLGSLPGMMYSPGERNWFNMCCHCLLYTSPSPRDRTRSRMPSSA